MLVLSRKRGERIRIGDDITIVVTDICLTKVKLAIEAPRSIKILREELSLTPECDNDDSSNSARPSNRPDAPHEQMA
ncbi:MAG: carbon storage regulator [Fuerstiella sp.]|nr:carbon storage regulator [Fuerstiella sp.]MCP4853055.1 carbon storage regulator [Fuerstiella sp.]